MYGVYKSAVVYKLAVHLDTPVSSCTNTELIMDDFNCTSTGRTVLRDLSSSNINSTS